MFHFMSLFFPWHGRRRPSVVAEIPSENEMDELLKALKARQVPPPIVPLPRIGGGIPVLSGTHHMHPFKQSITESDEEYRQAARDMVLLSERIAFAAGLSRQDIETAISHSKIFEAGDFIIEPRSCCLPGGWQNVLMVTPRSVGPGVGWSNVSHNPFPDGWEYFPKGTRTVVAPSNQELADKIMNAVRSST